ncbi:MAG: hypothetical protein LBI31_02850, partial [Zoogloeaceae bacterium]|nr:hypothetical protein [Zoogloeaceae bacterium]
MKSSCYGASVFFIVIFAVALAGCAGTLPSNSTNEDRTPAIDGLPPKISALFQKTKTVCFGRFMIDLPESATIAWGTAAVPYDIEVYPKEGYKIKSQIKAKVDEITEEQHTEEPSMLIGVFDSVNPESKIVVGYESRHNTRGANFYSYIRLGDTAFVQESVSVPLVVGDKSARLGIREDKTLYKKDVEELSDIARRLRLRTENEIPDEQGVCIEEAFIAWPLDFCFERVQIGFYFPEVPDVNLSIQTTSTKKPSEDDTLEAGLRESRAMATESGLGGLFSRITTLRKGKRNIGKWEG